MSAACINNPPDCQETSGRCPGRPATGPEIYSKGLVRVYQKQSTTAKTKDSPIKRYRAIAPIADIGQKKVVGGGLTRNVFHSQSLVCEQKAENLCLGCSRKKKELG